METFGYRKIIQCESNQLIENFAVAVYLANTFSPFFVLLLFQLLLLLLGAFRCCRLFRVHAIAFLDNLFNRFLFSFPNDQLNTEICRFASLFSFLSLLSLSLSFRCNCSHQMFKTILFHMLIRPDDDAPCRLLRLLHFHVSTCTDTHTHAHLYSSKIRTHSLAIDPCPHSYTCINSYLSSKVKYPLDLNF